MPAGPRFRVPMLRFLAAAAAASMSQSESTPRSRAQGNAGARVRSDSEGRRMPELKPRAPPIAGVSPLFHRISARANDRRKLQVRGGP